MQTNLKQHLIDCIEDDKFKKHLIDCIMVNYNKPGKKNKTTTHRTQDEKS
jgi:hypothetical protein